MLESALKPSKGAAAVVGLWAGLKPGPLTLSDLLQHLPGHDRCTTD